MKTQYYTAASINGYIADENHSLDWLLQFGDMEEMKDEYPDFYKQVGALAMGSTTYEWVMAHMNLRQDPQNWPYQIPAWVFSNRELPKIKDADIRFVRGNVGQVHAEMTRAAQGKNIWIVGGGELAGQFFDLGLLDEIILNIAPVILLSGAPLLPRKITTPALRLIEVKKYGDIFAKLTYQVK